MKKIDKMRQKFSVPKILNLIYPPVCGICGKLNNNFLCKKCEKALESEAVFGVNDIIKKETGFTPKLFRPTYGGYSDKLKAYTNLKFILWTVDSADWKVKNTEKILNNILPNVKDGSIVLMHDNHSYAVKALDEIIKNLKDQGYQFVTVSELLEIENLRQNE